MRVVLDSNVLVSLALRSRALRPVRDAWKAQRFTLLVSRHLLAEVEEVLGREKFARYLTPEDRKIFLEELRALGEMVRLRHPFPGFEDPKDRFLLAMVRDGNAEALVTGDRAVRALEDVQGKPVLTPAEFLRRC